MALVTCENCGGEDLDRDPDAGEGAGIPIVCRECGHRFRRLPRVVCRRCGSAAVEDIPLDGWGYDDAEEAREHPRTASWSYVDRVLHRCNSCRFEWQTVEDSHPYHPVADTTTRLSPGASLADEAALSALADDPGVHVVHDPEGRPLYVGMSRHTRSGIRQHLTGDRAASILHEKVGRRLDRQLGRPATRDEIRSWLERCTFSVVHTEDLSTTKATLMAELNPELNENVPGVRAGAERAATARPAHEAVRDEGAADPSVVASFATAMQEIYRRAKVEAGYNATVFLSMLADRGPIDTARFLIHTPKPSDGFAALWERNRLDLTVEAHVLQERFHVLFSDDERDLCRERLTQYGWSDPGA